MNIVDGLILVLAALAVLHGWRVGAAAQLVSLAGFFAGLALGAVLVALVEPHVTGTAQKSLVALLLLFIPASLLGSAGRHLGYLSWRAIRRVPLVRPIDAAIGSLVALLGTLVVCWLLASILVNSQLSSISSAIDGSRIVRAVASALPPVPSSFAAVDRYLTTNGFPPVLINVWPERVGPVTLPTEGSVAGTAGKVEGSVLKVIALGCGDEQEGSSFAVADDLVVTNAHVVAGMTSIAVVGGGGSLPATPVYFDPRLDLALLRVSSTNLRPLSLDPSYVERGAAAAVLGYPGGGPFSPQPAGVLARFDAEGRDIYDSAITNRIVYELQADVQPGNSGGPLVTPGGEVLGVVFSRSAVHAGIGYALASPPVRAAIAGAEGGELRPVSTEACTD